MALWALLIGQCPCNGGGRFPWGIWVLVAAGLYAVTWWAESVRKKEGTSAMKGKLGKLAIVVVLVAAVCVVIALKKGPATVTEKAAVMPEPAAVTVSSQAKTAATEASASQVSAAVAPVAQKPASLPRLLDLGSTSCIPCKMMAPILEGIKKEQADRLEVTFVDVRTDPAVGQRYGIHLIPTQIFLDAMGKELWRHEGFMSKEEILAKWKELGVELTAATASEQAARAEEAR
jgi:thioredoxin 1